VGVVLPQRRIVGRLLRGLGPLGQQPGGYLGHLAALPRLRWLLFVANEFAVRVDAEPGEQRPLQRVAKVLEGARDGLKPGPLPPAQGQAAAGRDDHQSDQRGPATTGGGHHLTVPLTIWARRIRRGAPPRPCGRRRPDTGLAVSTEFRGCRGPRRTVP